MKTHLKKTAKIIAWTIGLVIVLLFALTCLFGIIFFGGMWYKDAFM